MRLLLPASDCRVHARRAAGLAVSIALHGGVALLMLGLVPTARVVPTASTRTPPVVVFVPPPPVLDQFHELVVENDSETASASDSTVNIAGFTFDVARIRARRNALFPFLTLDTLFLEGLDEQVRSASRRLINPFPAQERPTIRPPLLISSTAIQAVVDRTWSRRDRWKSFSEISALINAHDPNEGRLAEVVHAYLDQNILQPYYAIGTTDPRFWTVLGLAADHAEFIDYVRAFARRHPSSRTTTELLFLLDELAQGSRDALLILLDTEPTADLELTRRADRDAYELAVAVHRQYREWLKQRGLDSAAAINARYDELRLRVLSTIVQSTPGGYRAADARFLAGEIFFYQNDTAEALRWWRDITPGSGDSYAIAYSELLAELQAPSGLSAAKVIAVLGGERRRWLELSRKRLRQFGYTFTSF